MTDTLKSEPKPSNSRASTVQQVVSPGGIRAWLVEDYTVPLVALELAFLGGAAQDPPALPGVATLLAGLLDEGAGPYESEAFHRILEENAIELSFSADRDLFHGRLQTLARNKAKAFELLGLAIAQVIVKGHDGEIDVQDRDDAPSGARFIIRLPAADRQ